MFISVLLAAMASGSDMTAVELTSPVGFEATDIYGNPAKVYFEAGTGEGATKLLVVIGNGTTFKDADAVAHEVKHPSDMYDVSQLDWKIKVGGVLHDDPTWNPTYADWNKIWIPVTPGDRFEGQGKVLETAYGDAVFTGAFWPGAILESLPEMLGQADYDALDTMTFVGLSSGAVMAGHTMHTMCPAVPDAACNLIVDSYEHHERTADELLQQSEKSERAEIEASLALWGGTPSPNCTAYMTSVGRSVDDCETKAFYGLPLWEMIGLTNVKKVLSIGSQGAEVTLREYGWDHSPMDDLDLYHDNQAILDPIRQAMADMAELEKQILVDDGVTKEENVSYVFGFNSNHVVLDDIHSMHYIRVEGDDHVKIIDEVMNRHMQYAVLEDPQIQPDLEARLVGRR